MGRKCVERAKHSRAARRTRQMCEAAVGAAKEYEGCGGAKRHHLVRPACRAGLTDGDRQPCGRQAGRAERGAKAGLPDTGMEAH